MQAFKLRIFHLVFHLVVLSCAAQTLEFKRYTSSTGLLSDEIFNMHQDKKGYLWLFTNYGALKYNSSEFRQVLKNLPFDDSFIYAIYENEAGRKWVANSNAKIYEIRHDSAFIVPGTEKLSELLRKQVLEILQLHVDDSLNIYAITKHDSYKIVNRGDTYRPVNLSTGEKDSITYRIYEMNNRMFRVLNYTGNDTTYCGGRENLKLLLYEKEKKPAYFKLDCYISDPRFFKRYKDDIYFSHHDRICRIRDGKVISSVSLNSIVLNFTKDKNGHLWAACYNNGLFELNERDSVINHYFEKQTINDVLIDSQNGLWASSAGAGLFHCPDLNDLHFTKTQPLGKPISFIKKNGDELYAANTIGDIFRIKNGKIHLFKSPVKEYKPLDLIKEKDKYIIAGMYKLEQNGYFPAPAVVNTLTFSVIKMASKSQDTVFFLLRKRLLILEKGKFKRHINFDYKAYSFELRNNQAIIAMENGIWLCKDSLYQPQYLSATRGSKFRAIVKDTLDNYWLCSEGNGLFKLSPDNTLQHYHASNGLPENIINNISFDPRGILLSTNTGLYYIRSFATPQLSWKSIYTGAVQNALFFEDKIYLSTSDGLVILNKKKIYDTENLHFNLKEIRVNTKQTALSTFQTLDHDQNNLEFIFDVISFNQDKYKLRYYLDGVSKDSGLAYTSVIGLKKLPPGNYTLTVYPDVVNGQSLQRQIAFTIVPAFWQTNTFIFFIVSLIILLCILVIHLILKFLRKKEDKKNKAERLIQEYKLIALKAQINPHFMSNCLTAIQHLIINNKVDLAADYIAKFGLLVRQILNFSTRSLVSLQDELEIASLNMELEQLRFENKFLVELKTDPALNLKTMFVPALILNPIIENAIWHGLLPLKNKRQGKLLIETRIEENTLLLIIEDNGVGRKPKPGSMSNTRESKGIALTEQRLNNINYIFNITTSQLLYQDLNNDITGEYGTRVIISLPVNLKPLQNE